MEFEIIIINRRDHDSERTDIPTTEQGNLELTT
jgi:hypothetical protein